MLANQRQVRGPRGWLRERWDAADVESRKALLRALGIRVNLERIGPGNGRVYDPDTTVIVSEGYHSLDW